MSKIWNKLFITSLLLLVATLSMAQSKNNSPYSRLGLGDLLDQNFASLNGMGNLSATIRDPHHINLLNPASLSALRATSFEFGVRAKYASLKSDDDNLGVWSGDLAYISLAFPIINPISEVLERKKSKVDWGMNFALMPYSTVDYNVETIENRADIGLVTSNFEGSGGTYKFMWGNGLKIKNVSFGANLGYVFGKTSRDQQIEFDSLEASYSDIFHDDFSVNGFVWNVGVQYEYLFKEQNGKSDEEELRGDKIIFGLYGNSDMGIKSKRSQLYQRFNRFYNAIDSIRSVPITTFDATLPMEISGGVMYEKANKLRFGVNYSQSMWSNYENDAKFDDLKNAYEISVGAEIIPQYDSYNSYLKKMRYRIGAFYGTDARSDGFNKQLTSYGITLGLGLPIILPRQQVSFLDLAFEIGQFGSSEALQETYINMTMGFTLNDDKWFFKRKFN